MSGKQPEKDNPIHQQPPDKNIFGLETPLDLDYQDPYFQGPQADEVASKEENTLDPEEEWFWQEPANFWLDQDIWPWPNANQRAQPDVKKHPK